ncbi:DNA-binding LacI/PurR family transcriptional regulator [Nocardioides marinisabuli]|uniref:DNA-binding LacI/PurR family transcriptional regulator n=1 Tax=Nocardioides marinisabuli TaxID=419476 RepID=A0A7Y9JPY4_9ACTN|nr:LacI family DNA-binding transcriptional regulator [Nocardioides marinisabuli]NYD56631.1 DNA-binding LacI/PurR family transcriptional regulator [Nocardioides marinisabuli]
MGRATLQSIADEVGVSRMTISNAFSRPEKLSADLRTRILAVAEKQGYAGPDPAARALARGRTGTVGLLVTGRLGDNVRDAVGTQFLVAVADALSDHGLALTLIVAGVGSDVVPARDVPMDGALVYVSEPGSPDVEWLRKRELPLVTIDQDPLPGVPSINVDDLAGARAAAQHLLDLGHRRIGTLNLDPVSPPSLERARGWAQAFATTEVEVVEVVTPFRPPEAAYTAAVRLLSAADRPTAVLCYSDAYAAQALRAAESLGLRVPDDVSVVGFDDGPLAASLSPALTTVAQDVTEKGRLAVTRLLEVTAARAADASTSPASASAAPTSTAPRTVMATSLVVRDSTAPPPAQVRPARAQADS